MGGFLSFLRICHRGGIFFFRLCSRQFRVQRKGGAQPGAFCRCSRSWSVLAVSLGDYALHCRHASGDQQFYRRADADAGQRSGQR